MMKNIIIQEISEGKIGLAERKGIGHPDTVCDEITEQVSVELCRYYLKEFGHILHHNVDKALLIGGQSAPAFKGGKIIQPISLILAGRATSEVNGKQIPVAEIAIETARKWLQKNIPHLNSEKDIEIISKIRPGSGDLVNLFSRYGKGEVPLSNDTSFGAGFYPISGMEKNIIDIEKLLNSPLAKNKYPFIGEDIKVMGVEMEGNEFFTIAIAIIDRYISDLQDYISKINQVKEFICTELELGDARIQINTADDYRTGSVYLTVTGTSAENGDDGQVGRGNRINGLITPYHPMSMEATSGKNPVSHIGKIYNYFAMDLSKALVENNLADYANVFIVSQIGKPIDNPQLLNIKLKNRKTNKNNVEELAELWLAKLPDYWKRITGIR
jgi:S-adenosylmethionine synthetase